MIYKTHFIKLDAQPYRFCILRKKKYINMNNITLLTELRRNLLYLKTSDLKWKKKLVLWNNLLLNANNSGHLKKNDDLYEITLIKFFDEKKWNFLSHTPIKKKSLFYEKFYYKSCLLISSTLSNFFFLINPVLFKFFFLLKSFSLSKMLQNHINKLALLVQVPFTLPKAFYFILSWFYLWWLF